MKFSFFLALTVVTINVVLGCIFGTNATLNMDNLFQNLLVIGGYILASTVAFFVILNS